MLNFRIENDKPKKETTFYLEICERGFLLLHAVTEDIDDVILNLSPNSGTIKINTINEIHGFNLDNINQIIIRKS